MKFNLDDRDNSEVIFKFNDLSIKNFIQSALLTPKEKMSYIKHLLAKIKNLLPARAIPSYNPPIALANPINEERSETHQSGGDQACIHDAGLFLPHRS